MSKPPVLLIAFLGLLAGGSGARAADHLRGQSSAFLQTFGDSPVDWMPWGDAALARARAEQKPVFLFIGSFASELAAAMRRQSFGNAKTAEWLNQQFVCVLVDRDERPDIAALFADYVSTAKQLNGWPLNVFLTPDFRPYDGATYLSPSEDWGAPGFLKLAKQAQTAWATEPAACRKRADEAVAQLREPPHPAPAWDLEKTRSRLAAASAAWEGTYDPAAGSFGETPKAPEPELLRFMLLQSAEDRQSAVKVLQTLAASPIRDPLDGGFFHRASDGAWRIPYPQKFLIDQARLALAYLEAPPAKDPNAPSFRACAIGALDYALRHLATKDGGYAAVEDATGDDSVGYYTWSEAEIQKVLGPDADRFCTAYGIQPAGNVPAADDPSSAFAGRNFLVPPARPDPSLALSAARLLAARNQRKGLRQDPRASVAALGLFMNALARAGAQYLQPQYEGDAHRVVGIIQRDYLLGPDGALSHLPHSTVPATAQDYAAAILGYHALAQFTRDHAVEELAGKFRQQLASLYFDAATGGYFAAPLPLPPGLCLRPLAGTEDPPTAAALAIPAHALHSTAVAATLSDNLEEGSMQGPGDQLLALALLCGEGPRR